MPIARQRTIDMKKFYIGTPDLGYDLYHHGILGQKWGIRRFQNSDGSLTAEGRKRYGLTERIDLAAKQRYSNYKNDNKSTAAWDVAYSVKQQGEATEEIKNAAEKIKNQIDSIVELTNKTFDIAEREAKAAIKSPEFKKEFEKRLYENFGNGCDDDEEFDWVKREIFEEIITKYCPKYLASQKKLDDAKDHYLSDCKKAADALIKDIGDKTILSIKNESVKYSDIVDKLIYYESRGDAISRLFRHPEETFEYATEDIGYTKDYPLPITMDEYNKKYGK